MEGERHFKNCLVDYNEASNVAQWQWVAGCGPDAAPYFRIFNPQGQAEKFDGENIYLNNYLNQGCQGSERALSFYEAIPKSWNLSCEDTYPDAIIDLKVGRERALLAYKSLKSADNEKFS